MAATVWKQARVGMLTRPLEELTSSPTLKYRHAKRTLVQAHRHLGRFCLLRVALLWTRVLPSPLFAWHRKFYTANAEGETNNMGLRIFHVTAANKGCTPELPRLREPGSPTL